MDLHDWNRTTDNHLLHHHRANASDGRCGDSRPCCVSGCAASRSDGSDGESVSGAGGSDHGLSRAGRMCQFRTTWSRQAEGDAGLTRGKVSGEGAEEGRELMEVSEVDDERCCRQAWSAPSLRKRTPDAVALLATPRQVQSTGGRAGKRRPGREGGG